MNEHARDAKQKVKSRLAALREDGEDLVDVRSIKRSLRNLARDIKHTSADTANDAMDYVSDRVADAKSAGIHGARRVEQRIKTRPGQSIAIAFTAGLLTSFLLGGNRKEPHQ